MHFEAAIISKNKDNYICLDALRIKSCILRCITIDEESSALIRRSKSGSTVASPVPLLLVLSMSLVEFSQW